MTQLTELNVSIPQANFSVINFNRENIPGIAVIDISIKDFEPKEFFGWHLSIVMNFKNFNENGMPSKQDVALVNSFGERLDWLIKGEDKSKPNALFVGRITWNKTRQFIWRIHQHNITNLALTQLIEKKDYPREFEYKLENDEAWNLVQDYFNGLSC
jgi:hypothetical protein